MTKRGIIAAGLMVMVPHAACAQTRPPVCTAAGLLPPELSAWSMVAYRDAVGNAEALPRAQLTVGETARVTLLLSQAVTYPNPPEKPAASGAFGGLLEFVVPAIGSYRVVLGSRAWIDLVSSGGKTVASTAHSMGPACTGIRKMVDFALAPGRYTLQISGNTDPATSVLVIRLP